MPRTCTICAQMCIADLASQLAPERYPPYDVEQGMASLLRPFQQAADASLSDACPPSHTGDERIGAFVTFVLHTQEPFEQQQAELCQPHRRAFIASYLALFRMLRHDLALPKSYREPIPPALRRAIMVRDELTCTYCKQPGDERRGPDGHVWHIDHVMPYSGGGETTEENLVLACATCNLRKHDTVGWTYPGDTLAESGGIPLALEPLLDDQFC